MMFETVYKVRIVYKSGYTHTFECIQFEISGNKITWESADTKNNRPIKIGFDEIAAVWQVGHRKRLKFFNK